MLEDFLSLLEVLKFIPVAFFLSLYLKSGGGEVEETREGERARHWNLIEEWTKRLSGGGRGGAS